MLDMLYLDMLVVRTYNHCRSVSKKIFWCSCCSLLIFVAKKAAEGTELQFLCTKAVSPSKVEE